MMKSSLEDLRQRRSELQAEHDSDQLAFEAIREKRQAHDRQNVTLLQQEKMLRDKMFRSFVELAQAVSTEQEMEIARLTKARNSITCTGTANANAGAGTSSAISLPVVERNLPLKKRPKKKRVKMTSRKEFYHKCTALHQLVSSSSGSGSEATKATNLPVEWDNLMKKLSTATNVEPVKSMTVALAVAPHLSRPPSLPKDDDDDNDKPKKPDPPGIGAEASQSLLTLSGGDYWTS